MLNEYNRVSWKQGMKKHKKFTFKKVTKILLPICLFMCYLVLIIEAALPANISADHSNTIGGGIADIVNNNSKDQAVIIKPTSVKIKNRIYALNVSDEYQLETKLLPENTTFTSLSYISSNPDTISVDSGGKLKALAKGKSTITVFSTGFDTIKDSMEVKVNNIEDEKISSSITLVTKDDDGVYSLEANRSYNINTSFTPENTTIKTLSYDTTAESDVLSVVDGTIYTYKQTKNVETITVTSSTGKISTLKVRIKENEVSVIKPTSISIRNDEYVISINETVNVNSSSKFKVSFLPTDTTYKTFKLKVDDSTICYADGTTIKGLKEGETTLHVTSLYDQSLKCSRKIKVGNVPLKSVKVSLNSQAKAKIKVGETATIKYSSYSPSNATSIRCNLIRYKTESPNITLTSNKIKGLRVSADNKVNVCFYNSKQDYDNDINPLIKTLSVEVFQAGSVFDFTYTDSINESSVKSENILYTNKSYNLKTGIKAEELYADANHNKATGNPNKTLKFEILSDHSSHTSDTVSYSLKDGIFNTAARDNFYVVIKLSLVDYPDIYKTIFYQVINEFSIESTMMADSVGLKQKENSSYNIYVTSNGLFSVHSQSKKDKYKFEFVSADNSFYALEEVSSNYFKVRGIDEGTLRVKIQPIFTPYEYSKVLKGVEKTISISIHHKYVDGFTVSLTKDNKKIDLTDHIDGNKDILLPAIVGSTIKLGLNYYPFENPTKMSLSVSSTNPDIATFKNNVFKFLKVGTVTYTIKENIKGFKKKIAFVITNTCELDPKTPFVLKQSKLSYDKETNTYHIENGTSAKIVTKFKKGSTYRKVDYSSEDTSILAVGDDGIINPSKVGETVIHATINDHNSINISFDVKIAVDKKAVIDNMAFFLRKIRKGIGHFGAFLVTSIVSTLTLMVLFDKKLWLLTVPINYIQGLFLADLTEFIQLFTPGRCGTFSDVLIDFSGFAIGATFITLILLALALVSYLKTKKAKEYQKEVEDIIEGK